MTRSVRIAKSACMADFEVTGSVNYSFLCRLENAILIYFCLAIARQGAGHNCLAVNLSHQLHLHAKNITLACSSKQYGCNPHVCIQLYG